MTSSIDPRARRTRPARLVVIALLAGLARTAVPERFQDRLPSLALSIAGSPVRAEIACTSRQWGHGLAHRASVPDGTGMLFVFDRTRPLRFTMRDTLVDLTIVFATADGTVTNVERMPVGSTEAYHSAEPAAYALEVPMASVDARALEPGSRLPLPFEAIARICS